MSEKPVAAVVLFPSAQALLEAIPQVRAKNLGRLEAYTPYPVHGLAEALGIGPSPLGALVFVMAVLGGASAIIFQGWTSAVDYPIRIGGKALFSWQAFIPIVFEVLVLVSAFSAGLGMLFLFNRLPWFGHPILASAAMAKITRDRFALAIEARQGTLDVDAVRAALLAVGGEEFELLFPGRRDVAAQSVLPLLKISAVVGSAIVAGAAAHLMIKSFPVLPPMNAMENQGKVVPYRTSSFFADGRAMRVPVAGTVPRGSTFFDVKDAEEAGRALVNPLPRSVAVFRQGARAYETFCRVCHGPLGKGDPSLSEQYRARPANLHSATIRNYPDGRIFYVISEGWNTMPGYQTDISAETRWAVVHYLRALQRSQDAEEGDLP